MLYTKMTQEMNNNINYILTQTTIKTLVVVLVITYIYIYI